MEKVIIRKEVRACKSLYSNMLSEQTEYPVFVGHRGQAKIRTNKRCTKCDVDAGLLLITLPSNRFLRPRTEAEAKVFQELVYLGALTPEHVKADRKARKLRLCPSCIRPYRIQWGHLPVQLWGGKSLPKRLIAETSTPKEITVNKPPSQGPTSSSPQ